MTPFVPLVPHPHLLTIAANFWPRPFDQRRFPVETRLYCTEPGVQVMVRTQRPANTRRGDLILVHGLEGSSEADYMKGLAHAALEAGFAAHRSNMRTCGGTEALCPTGYHSGLTSDLLAIVRQLAADGCAPLYLAGFSLGGNVVLKLAGELGDAARTLIAGVCAISTPIDLAACVQRLEERQNRIYELRFLIKLKNRIRRKHALLPGRWPIDGLNAIRSLREFDNHITAPAFGFRDAAEYYATQSSARFLGRIRVPALLIQAKDDPVVPFEIFERPGVLDNPCIELLATEHGGHLGFLSRRAPRFWSDLAVVEWLLSR